MDTYRFHMPVEVRCGAAALDVLGDGPLPGKRPAILCGRSAARRLGHLDAVMAHLPNATVIDGVPENPTFHDVESLVPRLQESGADFLIALGGGSVLDCAKAMALLHTNGGACRDYLGRQPHREPMPIVAIPTTAGTGSETTPYAVLVDQDAKKKATLKAPGLFPRLALLDPALTTTLPREVTLATGLDALSQAMEGMLSLKSTPVGDVLALDICRQVYAWLPVALEEPDHIPARMALLHAAMLSGVVIAQSGTTLVHGMGYYYTLDYGIAHGIANALLLPPVFRWNGQVAPAKVSALAEALSPPDRAPSASPEAAIVTALHEFYEKIQFSYCTARHGVPEAASEAMAHDIAQDAYRFKNQVGELREDDVRAFYADAWHGR